MCGEKHFRRSAVKFLMNLMPIWFAVFLSLLVNKNLEPLPP